MLDRRLAVFFALSAIAQGASVLQPDEGMERTEAMTDAEAKASLLQGDTMDYSTNNGVCRGSRICKLDRGERNGYCTCAEPVAAGHNGCCNMGCGYCDASKLFNSPSPPLPPHAPWPPMPDGGICRGQEICKLSRGAASGYCICGDPDKADYNINGCCNMGCGRCDPARLHAPPPPGAPPAPLPPETPNAHGKPANGMPMHREKWTDEYGMHHQRAWPFTPAEIAQLPG